jgi:hypothetical protein
MMEATHHMTVSAVKKRDFYTFLVRGSELRPTRFHDEKGTFAIRSLRDVADCAYALATAVLRRTFGWRLPLPWIALPALRHIQRTLSKDATIFEWGSGMSTIWYERNYREVHAVEDNPEWYQGIVSRVRSARVYLLENENYIRKLSSFPEGHFDLIVIDGSHRFRCFEEVVQSHSPLKEGGIIVIDNSDKDRTTHGDLWLIDEALAASNMFDVRRFTGWSPGNFFPQETTVVRRRSCAVNVCAAASAAVDRK